MCYSSRHMTPGVKNWLVVVIVVVGGVLLLAIGGQDRDNQDIFDAVDARVACQNFIEERLVSPATAEFAGRPERVGDVWLWRTEVDSENGFGALVRTRWECAVNPGLNSIEARQLPR